MICNEYFSSLCLFYFCRVNCEWKLPWLLPLTYILLRRTSLQNLRTCCLQYLSHRNSYRTHPLVHLHICSHKYLIVPVHRLHTALRYTVSLLQHIHQTLPLIIASVHSSSFPCPTRFLSPKIRQMEETAKQNHVKYLLNTSLYNAAMSREPISIISIISMENGHAYYE